MATDATDGAGDDGSSEGIYARESAYLDRWVQIGMASGRVLQVSFPETTEPADHALLDRLFDYLDGVVEDEFDDVAVALTVAADQRAVLEALERIPYGESVSVAELARMAADVSDDESGHRTVREALAANPGPILIPDHRVTDGPSAAPPDVEGKLRSLEGL